MTVAGRLVCATPAILLGMGLGLGSPPPPWAGIPRTYEGIVFSVLVALSALSTPLLMHPRARPERPWIALFLWGWIVWLFVCGRWWRIL